MSATGIRPLDRQIDVAMEWINDVDREFGWADGLKTYHAITATLHALRDRLSVNEAADLAAQLPSLLRGVYYEGYQPARMPADNRTAEQFLEGIRKEFHQTPVVDAEMIARRVFAVLARRVSAGEIKDVRSMLPRSYQYLWPADSTPSHHMPPSQRDERPRPSAE